MPDMPRSPMFLLLAVLISRVALAQQGVEMPVSPDVPAEILPAASSQFQPIVASNGRGFLAVWMDERNGARALYAVRLDRDGRPVTPYAQRLAENVWTPPVITPDADGSGYVVAWHNGGAPTIVRVDEDGRIVEHIDSPRDGNFSSCEWKGLPTLLAISTNGATFAVTAEQYCYAFVGRLAFVRRTAGGAAVITSPDGGIGPGPIEAHAASFTAFRFYRGLTRVTFDEQGNVLGTLDRGGTLPNALYERARMALTSDRLLIAGYDSNPYRLTYTLLDRDGNVVTPAVIIPAPEDMSVTNAFWDGTEFLITLATLANASTLSAVRVSSDGVLLTPQPIVLSTTGSGQVAIASDGVTRVLLWRDTRFTSQGDIVSRAVSRFADLANPSDVQLVSYSARAQANVRVTASGSHRMFVWSDGQEIGGRLDARELRIGGAQASTAGAPVIAASDRSFLVAWKEKQVDNKVRLMSRRYGMDGTPLDAQPRVLAADLDVPDDVIGVASDGSSFLVVTASRTYEMMLIRVDASGGTFDVVLHPINVQFLSNVVPVWTGENWFVSYVAATPSIQAVEVSPHLESYQDAGVPFGDHVSALSAVAGGGQRISFVWLSRDQIRFAQTSSNGILVFGPIDLPAAGPHLKTALAWTGSLYVLAWADDDPFGADRVRAIRLTASGGVLDPIPIEIASSSVIASAPSIARIGSGVIIAYSKDDASQTGVARAFFRNLGAIDFPRRPAVRH
jgi:hypothetical protein